jgi:hypothetical protein
LSQDTAVRVEFLLGNFGATKVLEGISSWLSLLTPEVMDSMLYRLDGACPRFQLQRLYRRFVNAARTDLLLPLLTHAHRLYPAPSRSTLVSQQGGENAVPKPLTPISMGFNPSCPDEDLIKLLATAETVPDQLLYLVKEGVEGGWAVANDQPLTALLTLKHRYLLDPNFTQTMRSPSTVQEDRFGRRTERNVQLAGFTTDSSLECASGAFNVLEEMIELGRIDGVRRLIALGVSMEQEKPSFF